MWSFALAALLLLAFAPTTSEALSVSVDQTRIGPPLSAGVYDFHSRGLNGTALNGQLFTIDLTFADDILARVLNARETGMLLALRTNASFSCRAYPPAFPTPLCGNYPGFPDGLTGYLIAPDGSALHAPQEVGGGMASDGTVSVGLDVTAQITGHAFDMSGVHLEFLLPSSGFVVTGALIRLTAMSSVQFGTAAQLPDGDPGSLILAVVAMVVLIAVRPLLTA